MRRLRFPLAAFLNSTHESTEARGDANVRSVTSAKVHAPEPSGRRGKHGARCHDLRVQHRTREFRQGGVSAAATARGEASIGKRTVFPDTRSGVLPGIQ